MSLSHEHVVYSRIVLPAKKSADGETPDRYVVTIEHSGMAVWFSCYDGDVLVEFFHGADCRERALEFAVSKALKRIAAERGDE